jgi:hypothetical protein
MLHGLSTRRYHHGLEPVGDDLPAVATSKSSVSRHFVAATRKAWLSCWRGRLVISATWC